MRAVQNVPDPDAVLLVIFGAPRGDARHVQWDDSVIRRASDNGDIVSKYGVISRG
jgi:hypothetical protein